MSKMKPAGYLNKFTGMIWNPEQQPGAESEPEIYEPLVRLSDVHGLVAENHALKAAEIPYGAIENGRAFIDRLEAYPFESQGGDLKMCSDWQSLVQCFDYLAEFARGNDIQTPATDAAIAEIKASELDDLARSIMEYAPVIESDEYHVYEVIAKDVTDRAANLRAGRKG